MAAEESLQFSDVIVEYASFVLTFLAVGAAGFRLNAGRAAGATVTDDAERRWLTRAQDTATTIGLVGAVGMAGIFTRSLLERADEKHLAVAQFLQQNPPQMLTAALLVAILVGALLARFRVGLGHVLASLVLVMPLRALAFGWKPERLVNPLHEYAAALWLGTLAVLVLAGVRPVLASGLPEVRRATLTKRMVDAFSPVALGCVALLVTMGVITAWRHLGSLQALWSSPYGCALLVKLVVVAGVMALGAVNWRSRRVEAGTIEGARALQRSAELELWLSAVVLVVTAVLVNLPAPGE